jgi:hypothetical protein
MKHFFSLLDSPTKKRTIYRAFIHLTKWRRKTRGEAILGLVFCPGTLANLIPSNKLGWTDTTHTHTLQKSSTFTPVRFSWLKF